MYFVNQIVVVYYLESRKILFNSLFKEGQRENKNIAFKDKNGLMNLIERAKLGMVKKSK